jgi:hypothetical protein
MPRLERQADRRREQHRHSLGLLPVPCGDQTAGIFEHLRLGRTSSGRFLLGGPARRASILRLFKPMAGWSPDRDVAAFYAGRGKLPFRVHHVEL